MNASMSACHTKSQGAEAHLNIFHIYSCSICLQQLGYEKMSTCQVKINTVWPATLLTGQDVPAQRKCVADSHHNAKTNQSHVQPQASLAPCYAAFTSIHPTSKTAREPRNKQRATRLIMPQSFIHKTARQYWYSVIDRLTRLLCAISVEQHRKFNDKALTPEPQDCRHWAQQTRLHV